MLSTERIKEFLKALSKLSHEYGIKIGTEGCMRCPWLVFASGTEDKRGYTADIKEHPQGGAYADRLRWETLKDSD